MVCSSVCRSVTDTRDSTATPLGNQKGTTSAQGPRDLDDPLSFAKIGSATPPDVEALPHMPVERLTAWA